MKVRRRSGEPGGDLVRFPGKRGSGDGGRSGVRWWAVLLLTALTLGAGAGYLWRVDEVRVVGVETIPAERILRAAALEGGEPLVTLRLGPLERRVEAIAEVRTATVRRTLGGAVLIEVQERVPLVRLDGHPELAADVDGRMFRVSEDVPLPVLTGWSGRAAPGRAVDPATRVLLRDLVDFPETLRERTVVVRSGGEIHLDLVPPTVVRFGEARDLVAKAHAADAVYRAAEVEGRVLAYIDVRIPSAPVAKDHEPEPPPDDVPDEAG